MLCLIFSPHFKINYRKVTLNRHRLQTLLFPLGNKPRFSFEICHFSFVSMALISFIICQFCLRFPFPLDNVPLSCKFAHVFYKNLPWFCQFDICSPRGLIFFAFFFRKNLSVVVFFLCEFKT